MTPAVRLRRWTRGARAAAALVLCGTTAVSAARADGSGSTPVTWEVLEPGLEFGTAVLPTPADAGAARIHILRVDPSRFELALFNRSASPDGAALTAREWSQHHGLVAAINASLYQADHSTSIALMKSRTHTNNPRVSPHNTVLLFDRRDDAVPPVQIVDRTCRDLAALRDHYAAMVQSIRMVSCNRSNVWSEQPENKWSAAAIGIDEHGSLLFIHVRSPLSTHDLIDALLALPLGLRETMYVEGGPEAQLYVNAGGRELEFVGSQGSSFAGIENTVALPIPNVLGVRRVARTMASGGANSLAGTASAAP
jgi:hypothetical protein